MDTQQPPRERLAGRSLSLAIVWGQRVTIDDVQYNKGRRTIDFYFRRGPDALKVPGCFGSFGVQRREWRGLMQRLAPEQEVILYFGYNVGDRKVAPGPRPNYLVGVSLPGKWTVWRAGFGPEGKEQIDVT